jgi:hypothetical protein
MPDFKQGKIYCLRSHQTDDVYIGSTCQPLSKRKVDHKTNYKRWKNGKCGYVTSFEIIKYDDCYIELLEECPCDNKNQLERREGQLIREMKCINKLVAGRSKKEYNKENKEQIKEYNKKYNEEHKEQIAEHYKKYYEANKEHIAKQQKKYYEENKEQIKEQKKEYREAHKNDFKCEVCNYKGNKSKYNQHLKTKKHNDKIKLGENL